MTTAPPGPDHTTAALQARLRELASAGAFVLPLPGGGATAERLAALTAFGVEDLSLGRLAEAHTDAVAIAAEAGTERDPAVLMGVWAAGGPRNVVVATPEAGGLRLQGSRGYCSGAGILDGALLPVVAGDEELLVAVDLHDPRLRIDDSFWRSPALAATRTATVCFDGVVVPERAVVGPPGFYLRRPGFWFGSVGVAAVWAGGADGVLRTMRLAITDDPHALAHLGAVEAICWGMQAALRRAAEEIDADPEDAAGRGMSRALIVRHLVERGCAAVVDHCARALGPTPMASDAAHAQRIADLQLYVRQVHAERDLEAIGAWHVREQAQPGAAAAERGDGA